MSLCEHCGSSSRDKSGVCAGCGAVWPLAASIPPTQPKVSKQSVPYARMTSEMASSGLVDLQPKKVWVAVPLALIFGPLGLLYCTTKGAIVMLIVSLLCTFFWGQMSTLLVLPICGVWAWRAARETTALFD